MPTSIQWCSCACHYLDPRKLFEWFRDKWMYPSWLRGMKGVNWSEVIIIVPGQIKFSQGTLPLLKRLEMTWRRFTSIILLSWLQQWSRNAVSIIHIGWHGLPWHCWTWHSEWGDIWEHHRAVVRSQATGLGNRGRVQQTSGWYAATYPSASSSKDTVNLDVDDSFFTWKNALLRDAKTAPLRGYKISQKR